MADSLLGVLCQVASAADGQPRPRTSSRFGPPRTRIDAVDWQTLPNPIVPNHPRIANRVAGIADDDAVAALALAGTGGDLSWADAAVVARAQCEVHDFNAAMLTLNVLDPAGADATDVSSQLMTAWAYLSGVVALAVGDHDGAVGLLDAAYAAAPGESAGAFAYAAALELAGDVARFEEAADLYEQVSVADPSWVAAVAGLARMLAALGRPVDAARVLAAVPESHPSRAEALTLACRAMEQGNYDDVVAAAAGERLLAGGPGARGAAEAELAAALFAAAGAALRRGESVGTSVAGQPAESRALARAAEAALIDLADATPDAARRHELLDIAARTRPWSLL